MHQTGTGGQLQLRWRVESKNTIRLSLQMVTFHLAFFHHQPSTANKWPSSWCKQNIAHCPLLRKLFRQRKELPKHLGPPANKSGRNLIINPWKLWRWNTHSAEEKNSPWSSTCAVTMTIPRLLLTAIPKRPVLQQLDSTPQVWTLQDLVKIINVYLVI